MAKAKLGELLVKAGVITESQLRIALAQQRQHGGKLGEHLVRTNLVTEQQLAIAVAEQLGLVYNDCSHAHASEFSQFIPHIQADRLQVLPVRLDQATDTLVVAVSDPLDERVMMEVAALSGKRIEAEVAPKGILRQAIKVAYASIEIDDEGTNEFRLVDLAGRESALVKVHAEHDELPEASVIELDPITENGPLHAPPPAAHGHSVAPAHAPAPARAMPQAAAAADASRRITPQAVPRQPVPPPVAAPQPKHDSGEEALQMLWALSDLLIEKGYLSRSELMAKLRGR
jgi:hypothetical protein